MDELIARAWEGLMARIGGPMTFRLILQPLMATLLAVRAGLKDAREGRPPYFWTLVTDSAQRLDLLREGWRSIARVFILAVVMDLIYEWLVGRRFYPLETLIVAIVLAVLPYLLLRGPVNRFARRLWRSKSSNATDDRQNARTV
jgi:hypothetical protein